MIWEITCPKLYGCSYPSLFRRRRIKKEVDMRKDFPSYLLDKLLTKCFRSLWLSPGEFHENSKDNDSHDILAVHVDSVVVVGISLAIS